MNKLSFIIKSGFILMMLLFAGACNLPEITPSLNPDNPTESFCVFVDDAAGSGGAPGTRQAPLADINEAIALAALTGKDVCVAQGLYLVDSSTASPSHIIVTEGVSLYGGYNNNSGLWTRSPLIHHTVIRDVTLTAGSGLRSAVYCGNGISRGTVIDGFEIYSGYGNQASALFCEGGSPTVSNNLIYGYQNSNSGTYNYSIFCNAAGPNITNNAVYGGANHESVSGIFLLNNSSADIIENMIMGGIPLATGISTYHGIYIENSSPNIRDNVVFGGNFGNNRYGIGIFHSTPRIEKNVIHPGTDARIESVGIYCTASSLPVIHDNVISGGENTGANTASYGILCLMSSDAQITLNVITGGSSTHTTVGIYSNTNADPQITGNIILGGSESIVKTGIMCVGTSPDITDNTINAGSENCRCIALDIGAAPRITGNKFLANNGNNRYGIHEADNESEPESVRNNIFHVSLNGGTNSGIYRDYSGGVSRIFTQTDDVNDLDSEGYNPPDSTSGNSLEL